MTHGLSGTPAFGHGEGSIIILGHGFGTAPTWGIAERS
ncbi:hypothetical protein PTI45_01528 [Paenibacillus nuruki]|uniref:Uncharacterized protein n=1 Tax=Paenibacillus nuruki TaxID=1886670 RepID=A0A1E3L5I4_9BACL|nr:hypothetical protein PTI45_01528 [Paenibacillus nuruki]